MVGAGRLDWPKRESPHKIQHVMTRDLRPTVRRSCIAVSAIAFD